MKLTKINATDKYWNVTDTENKTWLTAVDVSVISHVIKHRQLPMGPLTSSQPAAQPSPASAPGWRNWITIDPRRASRQCSYNRCLLSIWNCMAHCSICCVRSCTSLSNNYNIAIWKHLEWDWL